MSEISFANLSDMVGTRDGAAVGASVGALVGVSVGPLVGASVGLLVGISVINGAFSTFSVDDSVEPEVGEIEIVETFEGESEGTRDGISEGTRDGMSVNSLID